MKATWIRTLVVVGSVAAQAQGAPIVLNTSANFAVLGSTTVTNTGPTVVDGGNLGVGPAGSALTGFPPGTVKAPFTMTDLGNAVAGQANADALTAYNQAAGLAVTPVVGNLTGQDLGTVGPLAPGVYHFDTSAFLNGALVLNSLGDPNAEWVFQTGSTLITGSFASVSADAGKVYWQVGSSATIGTGTAFEGTILAFTSISMNTGATLSNGRALAINGAVTLDSNAINANGIAVSPVPEASHVLLAALAGLAVVGFARRRFFAPA